MQVNNADMNVTISSLKNWISSKLIRQHIIRGENYERRKFTD